MTLKTKARSFSVSLAAIAALCSSMGARPAFAGPADGAEVFKQNCAACHQPDGQGVPGAFPALAGDKFVQGDPKTVAHLLLNGRGGMPNFREDLSDEQIAAVLTYVRSSWGNHASPLDVAVVAAAAGGGTPRQDPSVLPGH